MWETYRWNLKSFKDKIQMKICKATIQALRWVHLSFLRIGLCPSKRWALSLSQVMNKRLTECRARWVPFKNATCRRWNKVRARLLATKREVHLGRAWLCKSRQASNCWKEYKHRTKQLRSAKNSIWHLKLTHKKIQSRSFCTINLWIPEMIAGCISSSWDSIKSQQPTPKINRHICTAEHLTITYWLAKANHKINMSKRWIINHRQRTRLLLKDEGLHCWDRHRVVHRRSRARRGWGWRWRKVLNMSTTCTKIRISTGEYRIKKWIRCIRRIFWSIMVR